MVCESVLFFPSLQVSLVEVWDYKFGVREPVSRAKIWRGKVKKKNRMHEASGKWQVIHEHTRSASLQNIPPAPK